MMTKGKSEPPDRPRRFYQLVEAVADGRGFTVRLDGRGILTPMGAKLCLPTLALAQLIAAEWSAQGEHIVLPDMPATRLAHTAIDAIAEHRVAVAGEVVRFAESDLLCYFADTPKALVDRQVAQWGPILTWAERGLGLYLKRTTGIIHQPQAPEMLERVEALALALNDFTLAGVAHAVSLFGSAVLAFAVERAELTGEAAFDLSRLDEAHQEGAWGVDDEAAARTARMRTEASMLNCWFLALSGHTLVSTTA